MPDRLVRPTVGAYAEIGPDRGGRCSRYRIVEPELLDAERALLAELRARLFDEGRLPPPHSDGTTSGDALRGRLDGWARLDPRLAEEARRARLAYYLERDLTGFGPIDVAMRDPDVEDISCDGVDVPLFVHHRRWGSLRTDVRFRTASELDRYVGWLAQRCGRHLSLAEPLLEATLPGGARLEASLGRQVTTRGSSFTIRRFRERGYSPIDLVRLGTMSAELMAYLWLAVESGESLMVCGGTASGKTTTLNALLRFVPADHKIVSIEDTRELDLPHENWVPLVTRGASGERGGAAGSPSGPIDMFRLLASALRQRPQYLAVGEVRGREAYTVFQAMATGKSCGTTFHAESVRAMVHRMESPPIGLPRSLVAALPLVLLQRQVRVGDRPVRRVQSVVEIGGLDAETGELVASTIFTWDAVRDRFEFTGRSRLFARLARERGAGDGSVERELDRRRELLDRWAREPVGPATGDDGLARRLAAYARDPTGTLSAAAASKGGPPLRVETGPAP